MKDRDVKILGDYLEGKNIALLITGSVAAGIEIPRLVLDFRRYGANVYTYVTEEARTFVTEPTLEWTSCNKVVSRLTSEVEHLREGIDAYVIAPATEDIIAKFAAGIADNAVATTLAAALGKMENGKTKILLAPAMHGDMANSIYRENLEKLVSKGVELIEPREENGKLKLAKNDYIVGKTIREVNRSEKLAGKRILVTGGPTPGKIDDIRRLTNIFRGGIGTEIAKEAYFHGADVKFILGPSGKHREKYFPSYLDVKVIDDFDEYYSEVMEELEKGYNIGIFSAAVADYIPAEVRGGKIPSQGALKEIPLKETRKVIKEVREKFPELEMVTFKFEKGITKEKLEEIAINRINQGYEFIVANRGEDIGSKGEYRGIIVGKEGIVAEPKSKKEVARELIELLG